MDRAPDNSGNESVDREKTISGSHSQPGNGHSRPNRFSRRRFPAAGLTLPVAGVALAGNIP